MYQSLRAVLQKRVEKMGITFRKFSSREELDLKRQNPVSDCPFPSVQPPFIQHVTSNRPSFIPWPWYASPVRDRHSDFSVLFAHGSRERASRSTDRGTGILRAFYVRSYPFNNSERPIQQDWPSPIVRSRGCFFFQRCLTNTSANKTNGP